MSAISAQKRPEGAVEGFDFVPLLPLLLVVMLQAAAAGAVMPVLPFHLRALGASPLVFGLVLGVEGISQFLSAPLLGRLSDRIGRKRVIFASQSLAATSLLLLALSHNVAMVFLARLLFGCTTGSIAAAIAYAAEKSSGAGRRQAIGLINAALGLGAILGAGLASLLSEIALSLPIWLAFLLCAGGALVTLLCLTESRGPDALSAPEAPEAPEAPVPPASLSLRAVFRLPLMRLLVAVMLCHFFAYGMYSSQLPNYLAEAISWNGQPIGAREFSYLVMADGLIGISVQIFVLGWLGRRLSEKQMILFIAGLVSIGFLAAGLASTVSGLLPALICVSMADALAKPTYIAALSLHGPAGQQGAIIGTGQALVALADSAAPIVAGAILGLGLQGLWIGASIAMALGGALLALLKLPPQSP